jgi:predicted RNase H-like nuclease (RuvC/YqgF family)
MTRAYEIAAALREFSFWAEYGEDADEQEKMTADLYAAADLIENQQRHIEALMKANDSLKDAIARRNKQIEDMKQGMAQLAKAVAVKEEMEWWND